jgi:tape measure domain-containing protein
MADSTLRLSIDARPAKEGARQFSRSADDINRSAERAARGSDRVEGSFSRLRGTVTALSGAFAALGGALAVREFFRLADEATRLENRLRLVTNTTEQLNKRQQTLLQLSERTRSGLSSTTNLYVRLDQALQGTGRSTREILQVTEAFNTALTISGSTSSEAAAATQQFSQAIAGSIVRAEEFNSLIDASPRLIRALINELEGVKNVGALRQLLEDGELTRDRVFEALVRALPRLRTELQSTKETGSDAFQQLGNDLVILVGNIDDAIGASESLRFVLGALENAAEDINAAFQETTGAEKLLELIRSTKSELENARRAADNDIFGLGSSEERIEKLEDRLFNLREAYLAATASTTGLERALEVALDPLGQFGVSLEDIAGNAETASVQIAELNDILEFSKIVFKETGEEGESAFQRVVESLRREIELVGATREERELSNALRRAEVDLTSQQGRQIAALVSRLEDERQAQEAANRVLEDATTGFLETELAARELGDTVSDAAEEGRDGLSDFQREVQRTGEQVGETFTDSIIRSFEDGFDGIRDLFDRFLQSLAATALNRGIVVPVSTAIVGSAPGLFGISGSGSAAAGQGGAASQAGNALSLGSTLSNIGSGLTTPSISASGLSNFAPSIFSSGSGAALGIPSGGGAAIAGGTPNALASGISAASSPLAIGGGLIGGLGAQFAFENNVGNSVGSALGGIGGGIAAGAAFGGPVGAALGALVGAFAGGGIGSLFGADSKPGGLANTRFEFDGGQLSGISPLSGQKDIDEDKANQLRQQQFQAVQQALNLTGASVARPFDIANQLKNRQETEIAFQSRDADPRRIQVSDEGADTAAVLRELLAGDSGILEGVGEKVRTAVANSTAEGVEELLSDVQFAQNFDDRIKAFNEGVQSLSDTIAGQTVDNINNFVSQIQEFRDRTRELGLGIEKANEASATYIRRQLGITDAIDTEKLSKAAQQQIRLTTTLEQIQNPTSDLRQLLDELGISAQAAAQATQDQIDANRSQRQGQLQLEAAGLSQAGQQISQFDQSIETLEADLERGIIGTKTFSDVLETRFAPIVENLSEDQLQTLTDVVEANADAFDNSSRLVSLLTNELDNFGNSVQSISESLRTEIENIRSSAGQDVTDEELRGNDPALSASVRSLLNDAGILSESQTTPSDDERNQLIRSIVRENPSLAAGQSAGEFERLFVAAQRENLGDVGQKVFDAFTQAVDERLPGQQEIQDLIEDFGGRDAVTKESIDNLSSTIESWFQSEPIRSVGRFLENNDPEKLLDIPSIAEEFEKALPDAEGLTLSNFSSLENILSRAQDQAQSGNVSQSLVEEFINFREGLPDDVASAAASVFQDIQNAADQQNRDTGGGTGGGTSGPSQSQLLAQLKVNNPGLFGDIGIGTRITAAGIGGTDVADTIRAELENVKSITADRASDLAQTFLDTTGNVETLQGAFSILNSLINQSTQEVEEFTEQQKASLRGRFPNLFGDLSFSEQVRAAGIEDTRAGTQLTNIVTAVRDAGNTINEEIASNIADGILRISDTSEGASAALRILNDILSENQQKSEEQSQKVAEAEQRVIDARQTLIDQLDEERSRFQSLFDTIQSGLDRFQVEGFEANARRQISAQERISGLLGDARQGNLPSPETLQDAIDALGGTNPNRFSSRAAFERSTFTTRNELRQLQDIVGDELTAAERQIQNQREQISELQDNTQSVDSVKAAVDQVREAVLSLRELTGDDTAGGTLPDGGGNTQLTGRAALLAEVERQGGRIDLPTGFINRSMAEVVPLDSVRKEFDRLGIDIPGFATGGIAGPGTFVAGENGPELVRSLQPSEVISRESMNSSAELRALREEVAELRSVVASGFRVNNKATKDMERRQRRWYQDEQEAGNI